MKEYKPSKEDIAFAKKVWDDVIRTQVLNPVQVKQAYKAMRGFDAQSQTQAKIWLNAYFTYQYKEVVKDLIDLGIVETKQPFIDADSAASPSTAEGNEGQSHSEDFSDASVELLLLENQYEEAETANEKRSLKMRINKLKKDAGTE